ncbi:efflux RND transporter periplasmic adaptor subunit [Flagellimonas aequoris]|uniref:HlyD family efflux transporter periplasmic adaptor subunit n=1 Tax=Flagellimonas aequoris TaxID=2306997 RepID=A0A418N6Z5_9FLAO|nr:HlyD family efflux transporter periplasmic adaptor subunit [Allomuricauda aequoris]RIV70533.1 HlyD family efflux transporter periplasmic adaptor subunit [Allomuricauda aequoris]TXK01960.1 HlyD family efflux transporter periplasmic adaptor subunit [Allomuricauda aequoris]
MRKLIISAVAGGIIILASLYFAGLIAGSKDNRRPQSPKVVKTVFVDTVKNRTVPLVVPANGNLKAKKRVELYSEVQGVFRPGSKLFRTGQEYTAGQTLIRIDADEYYASVQSAKSSLYNLLTSIMPDLRLDYPEIYPKWQDYLNSFDIEKTTPPLPEMSSEKEKFFITGRLIVSNYYNVKNLEQRLSKYTIAAPFNGVLTEALVTEGTLIRSGQKLGEFINIGEYELEVSVSKTYGDFLKVGKEVELYNLDRTNKYAGKVTRVNGRVDQGSQTITVSIEVDGDDLKEGQYLEASLEAREEANAIEINRSLLLDNDQIFVVKDSILDLMYVDPIYFTDKTVVLKNVPDGEVIVSKPLSGAYAGMLVKVYDESKSPKAQP